MKEKHSILGIIPARGGSKRLPRKNILPLANKPLIYHTIEAALSSIYLTDIVLTSDDDEILNLSSSYNIKRIKRPPHLSNDEVKNSEVIFHIVNEFKANHYLPDFLALLQPTSPIRSSIHIDECIEQLIVRNGQSAMSVCQNEAHPNQHLIIENNLLECYNSKELLDKRQSEFVSTYRQNGAIYVIKTSAFLMNGDYFQEPCVPYIMSKLDSIDIDDYSSFQLAEMILKLGKENE